MIIAKLLGELTTIRLVTRILTRCLNYAASQSVSAAKVHRREGGQMAEINKLVEIVARLRGANGCPWDRAQDPNSMRPYLLEETYEVLEAIDEGNPDALRKELGDLLFQVVFLARTAEEAGHFNFDDVVDGISEKMIRRHPHVFDPSHQTSGDEGDIESGRLGRQVNARNGPLHSTVYR